MRAARVPLATLAISALLAACAAAPRRPPPPTLGPKIAQEAVALIGTPYHFGGADARGFDCSGLVLYVYGTVGIAIPRTAAEQQRAAFAVATAQLAPGDLVFFRIRSRHVDHVGIYAGAGRFVHAPRAGLAVDYALLADDFYAAHFAGAGRFRAPPAR